MESIEHNELFDLAYRFVTETSENIFLTGKAGTGKTTFLKYLKENSAKNIIVAAPTGVAAINAGGVTLHSLFQLPFHPFLPTRANREELLAKARFNKQRIELLRKMELLVIDEISMVRCDVMDAIDAVLKSVRRNHQLPFGGVQLLCIGDLYQLPPVAQSKEWGILGEHYASPFFFDSLVIKELSPLLIELNKIYRQKEAGFVELLNKVRNNQMSSDDFHLLHSRFLPSFRPGSGEKYITLTSHNNQADLINQQQLYKIDEPSFTFNAVIEGDFPESMFPADSGLVLKAGAQVMFLKNDVVQKRYFNGKIGAIRSLDKDRVVVTCDDTEIELRPETWENKRYSLNRTDGRLEQQTLGSFTQYPLRLAWAITIHKSQGLTFEKVMIDAAAAFSSGQVYVALSRCTSLDGIVLLSRIPPAAISSNENVNKAERSFMYRGSLPERFILARKMFTQQLLEAIFSFTEAVSVRDQLKSLLIQHKPKLNDASVSWMERFSQDLDADKATGIKFNMHIAALLRETDMVEDNPGLQKRVCDAAGHFLPRFENYLARLGEQPLSTESKEVSVIINEKLNDLATAIYSAVFHLRYCKSPFTVTGFLQNRLKLVIPRFNLSCYAGESGVGYEDVTNPELLAALKRWRNMVCAESGQPVYMVASQASLEEISTFLPLSKKELMRITGFGRSKTERYGEDILEIVEGFCEREGLKGNMMAKPETKKKDSRIKQKLNRTGTRDVSLGLYKQGKDVAAIAKERNLTTGTIEGHLAGFVGSGEIDINELVSREKQDLILSAAARYGRDSHKTLVENLPPGISYGEIRMVLASGRVSQD